MKTEPEIKKCINCKYYSEHLHPHGNRSFANCEYTETNEFTDTITVRGDIKLNFEGKCPYYKVLEVEKFPQLRFWVILIVMFLIFSSPFYLLHSLEKSIITKEHNEKR